MNFHQIQFENKWQLFLEKWKWNKKQILRKLIWNYLYKYLNLFQIFHNFWLPLLSKKPIHCLHIHSDITDQRSYVVNFDRLASVCTNNCIIRLRNSELLGGHVAWPDLSKSSHFSFLHYQHTLYWRPRVSL